MLPHRALFALLGLFAVADTRPSLASKTIKRGSNRVVARAPPLPTSTLVTDFQKDGVNSSWAEGHPKAWDSALVTFKGPSVVDVSQDEKFVALTSQGNLTIRDLKTQELVFTEKMNFVGSSSKLAIHSDEDDGYNVFVSSWNYTVYRITHWRLSSTGVAVGEQTLYQGSFSSFDGRDGPFSPDGQRFLAIDSYNVVIYDIDKPDLGIVLTGHTNPVMSAAFSPDGKLVSTASWDSYGKVWDALTGELIHSFGPTNAQNWKTNFSPDQKYVTVAQAGKQPAIKIYSTSDMDADPIVFGNFSNWIRSAEWTSDSKLLAAGSYGVLQVFSIEEQKIIQRWEMEDHWNYESWDLFWIEGEDSSLKLAYRTTAGLEVYDFDANLKYRWGADADAQYDGGGSGDGTVIVKSQQWIGGSDADGSIRFYEFLV